MSDDKAAEFTGKATLSASLTIEPWKPLVGSSVYHRRADLRGRVEAIDGTDALVKYDPPYDPAAEAVRVPIAELAP